MNRKQRRAGRSRQSEGNSDSATSSRRQDLLDQALMLHQTGHLAQAEQICRTLLRKNARHPQALHLLGLIRRQQGDFRQAAQLIGRAITCQPDYAAAHGSLGTVFQAQGNWSEAAAAYRRVLALKPDSAEAFNNLGAVLREQGHWQLALQCYRLALRITPDQAGIYYNLAVALQDGGEREQALEALRRACTLKADFSEAESALLHQQQHLCDWNGLPELFAKQRRYAGDPNSGSVAPFAFLAVPASAAEQQQCARHWAARKFSQLAGLREQLNFRFKPQAKEHLRIGYVSADFKQHATAVLIPQLIELHDRQQFSIHGYSLAPDDGSEQRQRLVNAFDHFSDIHTLSFSDAAQTIHDDGVDILIDLNGYTTGSRSEIFALRPAPLQAGYLGFVATMGTDFIDYMITDAFTVPQQQAGFFDEQLVYLPDCYQITDRNREIAATPARSACGLPENALVFCCFNSVHKITPMLFEVWMRLLHACPDSVLWLLNDNPDVHSRLRAEAERHGVAGQRLVFASKRPPAEYLALYRQADLFLDTLPYNAHTTASDALWAGLPLLTCAGDTAVARTAGSLLKAIGLEELITYSLMDYEQLAIQLATDRQRLTTIRQKLQTNRLTTPLFDSERLTRHLETAYRTMWARYADAQKPQTFYVTDQE